jgi:hypothetical protein
LTGEAVPQKHVVAGEFYFGFGEAVVDRENDDFRNCKLMAGGAQFWLVCVLMNLRGKAYP